MHPAPVFTDRNAPRRSMHHANTIEWEDLPSFADALNEHLGGIRGPHASAPLSATPVWTETVPACLDPLTVSEPFHETVAGLATREVLEPDVFRHFFGASPKS